MLPCNETNKPKYIDKIEIKEIDSDKSLILHEIIILHNLISKLSTQVNELQEENKKYKNDISTINKVVAHYDESQNAILEMTKKHNLWINEQNCILYEEKLQLTKKQKLNRKKHLRSKEKRLQKTKKDSNDSK